MKLALLVGAATLVAIPAAAKKKLPSYPHALRCAALTEAAAKRLDPMSAEGRERFDHALYWGLAAAEMAKRGRLTAARFKQDQLDSGAASAAELKAEKAEALAELATCDKEVPPLK